MAKLKIHTFPDRVLAQKAIPIARVDKSFHRLADDMLETMYAAPGMGLAANQVGILERILVLDADYDLEELPKNIAPPSGAEVFGDYIVKNKKPQIFINPEIVSKEGSIVMADGCLSVPEYSAEVKRASKLVMKYQDVDGKSRKLLAEGLFAFAIQHEIDHLDGILYIDRLSPLKREKIRKLLLREQKKLTDINRF